MFLRTRKSFDFFFFDLWFFNISTGSEFSIPKMDFHHFFTNFCQQYLKKAIFWTSRNLKKSQIEFFVSKTFLFLKSIYIMIENSFWVFGAGFDDFRTQRFSEKYWKLWILDLPRCFLARAFLSISFSKSNILNRSKSVRNRFKIRSEYPKWVF